MIVKFELKKIIYLQVTVRVQFAVKHLTSHWSL